LGCTPQFEKVDARQGLKETPIFAFLAYFGAGAWAGAAEACFLALVFAM
jgi:hypothetical protein